MITFKVKYSDLSTWYDITDWVCVPGLDLPKLKIPFKSRNKDYSINLVGFDWNIPSNFDFPTGKNYKSIEKIRVNLNDEFGYEGIISKAVYDRDNLVYTFTVSSSLELLKNVNVLNIEYLPTSDPYDQGLYNTGVLYTFNSALNTVGLTYNLKSIEDEIAVLSKSMQTSDSPDTFETYNQIKFKELKFHTACLEATGQNIARGRPSDSNEYHESDWDDSLASNFFDLISVFCQMQNVAIEFNPVSETYEFVLITEREYYSYIAGDFKYEDAIVYDGVDYQPEENKIGYSIKNNELADYLQFTEDLELGNNSYPSSETSLIQIPNNFIICFVDRGSAPLGIYALLPYTWRQSGTTGTVYVYSNILLPYQLYYEDLTSSVEIGDTIRDGLKCCEKLNFVKTETHRIDDLEVSGLTTSTEVIEQVYNTYEENFSIKQLFKDF